MLGWGRGTRGAAPVPGFAAHPPGTALTRGIAAGRWWWRVFSSRAAQGSISSWRGTGAAAGGEDALGVSWLWDRGLVEGAATG